MTGELTELAGGTIRPAAGVQAVTAGEFAAIWNEASSEKREEIWADISAALDASYRALITHTRPEDVMPRLERLVVLERREAVRREKARWRARTAQARLWGMASRAVSTTGARS